MQSPTKFSHCEAALPWLQILNEILRKRMNWMEADDLDKIFVCLCRVSSQIGVGGGFRQQQEFRALLLCSLSTLVQNMNEDFKTRGR